MTIPKTHLKNQHLVIALLFLMSLAAHSYSADAQDSPAQKGSDAKLTEMRALRKKAAEKKRRVLYNDDGNDVSAYKTPEELIALRVKQVANTQVDTIFYCTGGGGLFWGHQPKVGEVLGQFVPETAGEGGVIHMRDGLKALKELGTDPLAAVVDFGHKNNMEVIWSYRMNNPEDSFAHEFLSLRKRTHPSYLMGTEADWDANRLEETNVWWTLEDFALPEVRDYVVAIFEDICQRYDVDGIELDFIRHPMFFRPNMEGLPATPEQVAMMTDMVRKIRLMTERVALERGRPILVVVRAPLSVASSLDIGLDIPTYLKEGLIDILIAGQDYVQMGVASELKDMVDLGHKYGVPVYALIVPPKPYALYREDIRSWRGAVMNRWYWGADGIYTFNLFPNTPDVKFSEMGSPETLKGLDKIFSIDNPAEENILGTFKMSTVAPNRLPITLSNDGFVTTKLPVGEDIVANAPAGKTASALLRFKIAGLEGNQRVLIKVNGQDLGPLVAQGLGLEMKVDPKLIVTGYNQIELKLEHPQTAKASVTLEDLVLTYN